MKEIRWHGRGGNGAFTAAKLLGLASSVYGDKYAQAFPSFGPERRGAPVLGFTRISDDPITDHSQIYECDCVIVIDETLCDVIDVFSGLKLDSVLIINTTKEPEEIKKCYKAHSNANVMTIDATQIALDILGIPIVNTVLLGAAVAATKFVSMDSVDKAIEAMMQKELAQKNKVAAKTAYEFVRGVLNE